MTTRPEKCATCRFFCQDVDPENRLYFDEHSGECRREPPRNNFVWFKTRPYHWCGQWEGREQQNLNWQKVSAHAKDDQPVLIYKQGGFCKSSGVVVAYWNAAFNRWHDDGDRLIDFAEVTHWMNLPKPPDKL